MTFLNTQPDYLNTISPTKTTYRAQNRKTPSQSITLNKVSVRFWLSNGLTEKLNQSRTCLNYSRNGIAYRYGIQ